MIRYVALLLSSRVRRDETDVLVMERTSRPFRYGRWFASRDSALTTLREKPRLLVMICSRQRAERVLTEKPYFWSIVHDAEQALDSVSNAAALVVAGDAHPFVVVLGGIQAHDTTIPDLGVFVFPDQLTLFYRMGPDWDLCELGGIVPDFWRACCP